MQCCSVCLCGMVLFEVYFPFVGSNLLHLANGQIKDVILQALLGGKEPLVSTLEQDQSLKRMVYLKLWQLLLFLSAEKIIFLIKALETASKKPSSAGLSAMGDVNHRCVKAQPGTYQRPPNHLFFFLVFIYFYTPSLIGI